VSLAQIVLDNRRADLEVVLTVVNLNPVVVYTKSAKRVDAIPWVGTHLVRVSDQIRKQVVLGMRQRIEQDTQPDVEAISPAMLQEVVHEHHLGIENYGSGSALCNGFLDHPSALKPWTAKHMLNVLAGCTPCAVLLAKPDEHVCTGGIDWAHHQDLATPFAIIFLVYT
jgi:hypothetical protein